MQFLGKLENNRRYRDIKLLTTRARRNYLVSEPNHNNKFGSQNLLAIEMKRTQISMNKPTYLGVSILEISKIVMHEFRYGYVKPKYREKKFVTWI